MTEKLAVFVEFVGLTVRRFSWIRTRLWRSATARLRGPAWN